MMQWNRDDAAESRCGGITRRNETENNLLGDEHAQTRDLTTAHDTARRERTPNTILTSYHIDRVLDISRQLARSLTSYLCFLGNALGDSQTTGWSLSLGSTDWSLKPTSYRYLA